MRTPLRYGSAFVTLALAAMACVQPPDGPGPGGPEVKDAKIHVKRKDAGCDIVDPSDKTRQVRAKPEDVVLWKINNDCPQKGGGAAYRIEITNFRRFAQYDPPSHTCSGALTPVPPEDWPLDQVCAQDSRPGRPRKLACAVRDDAPDACYSYDIHIDGSPATDPELVVWR